MKCGVQAAKRGGGINAATPTALYFLQIHSTAGDLNGKVVYLKNVLSPDEASCICFFFWKDTIQEK